jgi:hypothetical protein
MRDLTPEECEFIAGGLVKKATTNSYTDTEVGEVVVVSSPPPYPTPPYPIPTTPPPYDPPIYNPGPGGGGTSPPPPDVYPPCVSAAPPGVSPTAVMNAAKAAAADIASRDDETYEFGTLIWEKDGVVNYGIIQTQNSTEKVAISTAGVPDGAKIVGYIHNHPDLAGVNDAIPSQHTDGDWDQYTDLQNATGLNRGITVSPNLLLFLYTNEDHKVRTYDKNDKNTQTASCALQ